MQQVRRWPANDAVQRGSDESTEEGPTNTRASVGSSKKKPREMRCDGKSQVKFGTLDLALTFLSGKIEKQIGIARSTKQLTSVPV